MGSVRTIQHSESLDGVWEELIYSEARLLGDPLTRDLAPAFAERLATLETVRAGQYAVWRGEIVVQATVDTENLSLDGTTEGFGVKLFAAEDGKRGSARWKRYFPTSVSDTVKLALERQLARVRGWAASLRGEPEPELVAYADSFARHVVAGDAAVQGRIDAAAKRNDHRVREIVALIDDVNALRLGTLGRLLQRAVKNGKSREWAESFFRRSQRRAVATPDDGDDGGDEKPTA